jgi:hypothetical protein
MDVSNENANRSVITNYLSAERGDLTVILEIELHGTSSTVRYSNLIELPLMNGISDGKSLKGGNYHSRCEGSLDHETKILKGASAALYQFLLVDTKSRQRRTVTQIGSELRSLG